MYLDPGKGKSDVLELGEGTYTLTDVLDTTYFTIIRGIPGKTILTCEEDLTNLIYCTSNTLIEDIILDGASLTRAGIRLANPTNVVVRNVSIRNTTRNAVTGTGGTNVTLDKVICTNCHVGNVFDEGDNPDGWVFQNFFLANGNYTNITLNNCSGDILFTTSGVYTWSGCRITGHRSIDATRTGIELINTGSGIWEDVFIGNGTRVSGAPYNAQISLSGISDFVVDSVYVDAEDDSVCIELAGCDSGKVLNSIFKNAATIGISITSTSSNLVIKDNTIMGFRGKGIDNAADYCQIINNDINSPTGLLSYGINLSNVDWNTVAGNIIQGTLDASNKIKKGIVHDNGADTVATVITGNLIRDCTEHGVLVYASSAQTVDRLLIDHNISSNNNSAYEKDANVTLSNSDVDSLGLGFGVSGGSGGASTLDELDDVTITSLGNAEILQSSSGTFVNRTLAEAGIASSSHTHSASAITSGSMADARIPASNVTQHEGSITHQNLSGAGTNTHSQIDTHIADASIHVEIDTTGADSNGTQYGLTYDSMSGGYSLDTIEGGSGSTEVALNALDYSVTGDGSTDDTSNISTAISAARTAGVPLFFPAGDYRISNLSITDDVVIQGVPGLTWFLVDTGSNVGMTIDFTGSASSEYTPTAFTTVTEADSLLGADDETTRITMTSSEAANFAEGDIIAIYSSDTRDYSDGGSNNTYEGELAQVYKVDSGNDYIYLNSKIEYGHTTSPKIRILDRTKRCILQGIGFKPNGDHDNPAITTRFSLLRVRGTVDAIIENLAFDQSWRDGVRINCTYNTRISGFKTRNQENNPTAGYYGYGIDLYGMNHGFHLDGFESDNCRHVFTTNGNTASTPPTWYERGEPMHYVVENGIAANTHGNPLDTHEQSRWGTFRNVKIHGGLKTDTGSINAKGIQDRGFMTVWENIDIDRTVEAVNVDLTFDHGEDNTIYLTNITVRNQNGNNSGAIIVEGDRDNITSHCSAVFNGLKSNNTFRLMDVRADVDQVTVMNWHHDGDCREWHAEVDNNSVLEVFNSVIDTRQQSAARDVFRMRSVASETTILSVANFVLLTDASTDPTNALVESQDANGTMTLNYGNILIQGSTVALTDDNITETAMTAPT